MHHSARARQNVLVPGQPDGGAGTAVCRAARARRGGRPHYSARVALAMGALSLALVAIGCGSAGATSSRRSAGEVATCTASELKIGLVRSFAGLGSAGGIIGFTNRGTSACRLSGWPTFQALGADGRVVKGTQVQGTMYGPYDVHGLPVVTLEPGHPADVVFVGGDGPGRGKRVARHHIGTLVWVLQKLRIASCCPRGSPTSTRTCLLAPPSQSAWLCSRRRSSADSRTIGAFLRHGPSSSANWLAPCRAVARGLAQSRSAILVVLALGRGLVSSQECGCPQARA